MAEETDYREVSYALCDLMVHIGLFQSVAPQWPEHVQEGWEQRKEEVMMWANKQISELQEFASAFDE